MLCFIEAPQRYAVRGAKSDLRVTGRAAQCGDRLTLRLVLFLKRVPYWVIRPHMRLVPKEFECVLCVADPLAYATDEEENILRALNEKYAGRNYKGSHIVGVDEVTAYGEIILNVAADGGGSISVRFRASVVFVTKGTILPYMKHVATTSPYTICQSNKVNCILLSDAPEVEMLRDGQRVPVVLTGTDMPPRQPAINGVATLLRCVVAPQTYHLQGTLSQADAQQLMRLGRIVLDCLQDRAELATDRQSLPDNALSTLRDDKPVYVSGKGTWSELRQGDTFALEPQLYGMVESIGDAPADAPIIIPDEVGEDNGTVLKVVWVDPLRTRSGRLNYFEERFYSHVVGQGEPTLVFTEDGFPWIGPASAPSDVEPVNLLDFLGEAIRSEGGVDVEGYWSRDTTLYQSSPLVTRRDTEVPGAVSESPLIFFRTCLGSMINWGDAMNGMCVKYSAAEIQEHALYWEALDRYKI